MLPERTDRFKRALGRRHLGKKGRNLERNAKDDRDKCLCLCE